MRLAASAAVLGLFVISTSAGMSSDSQDPNPSITEGAASDLSRSLMPVQDVAPVPAPRLQLQAGMAPLRQGGMDRTVIERAIQALGARRAADKPLASAPQSVDPRLAANHLRYEWWSTSVCSVPLVRVPVNSNAVPLIEVRPRAPVVPMPPVTVPAPPCEEPTIH